MKAFATTAFVALVAIIMSTGATPASAACFTSGKRYASCDLACYHPSRSCQGYDGNCGAFQGTFTPGEVKSACVNVTPEQHVNMLVQNLNSPDSFDLGDSDYAFCLANKINAFDCGSQVDVAGWRFQLVRKCFSIDIHQPFFFFP
jgi:hypothetical protein